MLAAVQHLRRVAMPLLYLGSLAHCVQAVSFPTAVQSSVYVVASIIKAVNKLSFFRFIERTGIKSSHIRTLSGDVLVVSNSDLTNSRIHNYKQMERDGLWLRRGFSSPLHKSSSK
jgi:hypothetical protein